MDEHLRKGVSKALEIPVPFLLPVFAERKETGIPVHRKRQIEYGVQAFGTPGNEKRR